MNSPTYCAHEVAQVDVTPIIESAKTGAPRPATITYGKLPRNYDPSDYLEQAEVIFSCNTGERAKNLKRVSLNEYDHFNFALWFESRCPKRQQDKYAKEFALSLRGLGFFKDEQIELFEKMGLEYSHNIFRQPSPRFYPKVLPLSIWEILKRIPEIRESRKWKHNLCRIATVVSLIYQSGRIDYQHGTAAGLFSLSYLAKHTESSRESIVNDLILLERYNLIKCIKHGSERIPNHDEFQHTIHNDIQATNAYSLVMMHYIGTFPIVSMGCINSGLYSRLFQCFEPVRLLYGDHHKIPFLIDTWHRRHSDAGNFQKYGPDFFLIGKKKKEINAQSFPKKWHTFECAKEEIEQEKTIMESKIQTLQSDKRRIIREMISCQQLLEDMGPEHSEYQKTKQNLELAKQLLRAGIVSDYDHPEVDDSNPGKVCSTSQTPIIHRKFLVNTGISSGTVLWTLSMKSIL